ncbi:MAG: HEPN domain-containing protein [Nitrospiraceae bacterium]
MFTQLFVRERFSMSEELDLAHVVMQWVEKAEHDLLNVQNNLSASDVPWDTVCFHAQQCVEKDLKALLIWKQVSVPKTHDLRLLLQRIPPDVPLNLPLDQLLLLNRYTIEGRYPGDWEPITRQDGEQAITMARKVREAVRPILTITAE